MEELYTTERQIQDTKELVCDVFTQLLDSGMLQKQTMKQYCSISEDKVRFLPDRYVEGTCPVCGENEARGDQCDECGSTYEAHELLNPLSKLDPTAEIEVRDTDHFFFRLDVCSKKASKSTHLVDILFGSPMLGQ